MNYLLTLWRLRNFSFNWLWGFFERKSEKQACLFSSMEMLQEKDFFSDLSGNDFWLASIYDILWCYYCMLVELYQYCEKRAMTTSYTKTNCALLLITFISCHHITPHLFSLLRIGVNQTTHLHHHNKCCVQGINPILPEGCCILLCFLTFINTKDKWEEGSAHHIQVPMRLWLLSIPDALSTFCLFHLNPFCHISSWCIYLHVTRRGQHEDLPYFSCNGTIACCFNSQKKGCNINVLYDREVLKYVCGYFGLWWQFVQGNFGTCLGLGWYRQFQFKINWLVLK